MVSTLTDIDDARMTVLQHAVCLESEPVSLPDALDRVLAANVESADPVPPFDSSAMDGFALRSADVHDASALAPVELRIIGESRAGRPLQSALGHHEAVAISTGAIIPTGADAVVAVEQTRPQNGDVEILAAVGAGNYVRLAGDDVRAGQTVMLAGSRLGPAHLGVLASLGRSEIDCFKRPRVSVITTGDELVEPGEALTPGSIYDSNAHSIPALADQLGAILRPVARVADDAQMTRLAIEEALGWADVVVICGGVSVGVHDHVRPGLAELGVNEHFWGVSLRPGRPTWFGTQDDTLVFGLPGNPVSAMVTFTLFVAPALGALSGGLRELRRSTARMRSDYAKAPGRAHAVRCRLELHEDGWYAEPTGDQRSHILTSMLDADALAIIPATDGSVSMGEQVEIVLLPHARPDIE
jgi:molybdopterin molybdotransferase